MNINNTLFTTFNSNSNDNYDLNNRNYNDYSIFGLRAPNNTDLNEENNKLKKQINELLIIIEDLQNSGKKNTKNSELKLLTKYNTKNFKVNNQSILNNLDKINDMSYNESCEEILFQDTDKILVRPTFKITENPYISHVSKSVNSLNKNHLSRTLFEVKQNNNLILDNDMPIILKQELIKYQLCDCKKSPIFYHCNFMYLHCIHELNNINDDHFTNHNNYQKIINAFGSLTESCNFPPISFIFPSFKSNINETFIFIMNYLLKIKFNKLSVYFDYKQVDDKQIMMTLYI